MYYLSPVVTWFVVWCDRYTFASLFCWFEIKKLGYYKSLKVVRKMKIDEETDFEVDEEQEVEIELDIPI